MSNPDIIDVKINGEPFFLEQGIYGLFLAGETDSNLIDISYSGWPDLDTFHAPDPLSKPYPEYMRGGCYVKFVYYDTDADEVIDPPETVKARLIRCDDNGVNYK